jgi:very-short-patch-repair endonuclease
LDFYFQDFQVDFETDGEQHYTDERIIKSDRTRTEYLKSQNIETIRVRWSSFAKVKDENDKKEFIDSLIKDITNRQISKRNRT